MLVERGEIVGGCVLRTGELSLAEAIVPAAWLTSLCVDVTARGRGVATRALELVDAELRAGGVEVLVLEPSSTTLYARAGFEALGALSRCAVEVAELTPSPSAPPALAHARDRASISALVRSAARESCGAFIESGPLDLRGLTVVRAPGGDAIAACARLGRRRDGSRATFDGVAMRDPRALRALFAWLARAQGIDGRILWTIAPGDPRLEALAACRTHPVAGPPVLARVVARATESRRELRKRLFSRQLAVTRPLFT